MKLPNSYAIPDPKVLLSVLKEEKEGVVGSER